MTWPLYVCAYLVVALFFACNLAAVASSRSGKKEIPTTSEIFGLSAVMFMVVIGWPLVLLGLIFGGRK